MNWERAHTTIIQMRFGDVDLLGHVNNVAYAQYLETARITYLQHFEEKRLALPTVVARLEVDYRNEVKLGQHVTVQLLVSRLGSSSFDFSYRVLADGVLAAEARTVQVHVDRATRRPVRIPDDVRAVLEEEMAWMTTAPTK